MPAALAKKACTSGEWDIATVMVASPVVVVIAVQRLEQMQCQVGNTLKSGSFVVQAGVKAGAGSII
jgi:hypothetical protein